MKKKRENKTLKFSSLTAFYYVVVNAVTGFEGLYLDKLGISDEAIGILVAVTGIVAVIFQPITGRLIDKSKKFRIQDGILTLILGIAIFAAATTLFNRFIAADESMKNTFYLYFNISLFALMIVFTQLAMPLVNSLCMFIKNKGYSVDFGIARGIGSVAYAGASFVIGLLCEEKHFGYTCLPIAICVSCGFVVIFLFPFLFDKTLSKTTSNEALQEGSAENQEPEISNLLQFVKKYPSFVLLALFFSLIFIGHNILTTFVYQLIAPMGGTAQNVGLIGGIAACVELPAMFCFSLLLKKIKVQTLLRISGVFFLLKASLCLLSVLLGNIYIFYVAQVFQIGGFALFVPASVYYANSVIDKRNIACSQSFMTASNVLGGVLGSLLGGFLLEFSGSAGVMTVTVALSLLGVILTSFTIRNRCTNKD